MSGPTPEALRASPLKGAPPRTGEAGSARPRSGGSLRSNKHDVSSRFPFPAIGE